MQGQNNCKTEEVYLVYVWIKYSNAVTHTLGENSYKLGILRTEHSSGTGLSHSYKGCTCMSSFLLDSHLFYRKIYLCSLIITWCCKVWKFKIFTFYYKNLKKFLCSITYTVNLIFKKLGNKEKLYFVSNSMFRKFPSCFIIWVYAKKIVCIF